MRSFPFTIQDLIGLIIVYQGLQFSINLLTDKRKRKTGLNTILALTLGSLALNFLNMLLISLDIIDLNLGPVFGLCYGPLFLLYTKALIFADQKLSKKEFLHFVPALVLLPFVSQFDVFLVLPISGLVITTIIVLHIGVYLFIAYSKVVWFQKGLKDLVSEVVSTNLSWLKFLILFVAGLFLVVTIESSISTNLTLDNITIIAIYLFVLVLLNSIYSKGLRQPEIFAGITTESLEITKAADQRYKSSKLKEEEANAYIKTLLDYMESEKPFLEYELSIEELADRTDIPARYLSQIINERFDKNFFDYINFHRIETAKQLLKNPELDLRINEVMYDTGFSSKSTFNTAFKKWVGMTPSEYRRSQKN